MTAADMKSFMEMSKKLGAPRLTQEGVYLDLGRPFSREPLSASDLKELGRKLSGIHAFRVGECYMNACLISLASGLRFCEGMAAGLWPVPHGWVSYKVRAIDVTWPISWADPYFKESKNADDFMARVQFNIANCFYWGVEVDTDVIRAHILKQRTYSPLFDSRFLRTMTLDKARDLCYRELSGVS